MHDIEHLPGIYTLGYIGENNFRTIEIDMGPWVAQIPDGIPSIVHIRPGETQSQAYIAATTFSDGILRWQIGLADIGTVEGYGTAQISFVGTDVNNRQTGKSATVKTRVNGSAVNVSGDIPEPQQAMMDQLLELRTDALAAMQSAIRSAEDAETAKQAALDAMTEFTNGVRVFYADCTGEELMPQYIFHVVNGIVFQQFGNSYGFVMEKPSNYRFKEDDILMVKFLNDIHAKADQTKYRIKFSDEESYEIPNIDLFYPNEMVLFKKDHVYAFRLRSGSQQGTYVYEVLGFNPWANELELISESDIEDLFGDYHTGG